MSSPSDLLGRMADLAYLLGPTGISVGEINRELERQFPDATSYERSTAIDIARQQLISELPQFLPGLGITWEPFQQQSAQWEGELIIGEGESQRKQYVRVPREPGDTEQDVRDKLLLAQLEIETIIQERGGADTISGATLGEFREA